MKYLKTIKIPIIVMALFMFFFVIFVSFNTMIVDVQSNDDELVPTEIEYNRNLFYFTDETDDIEIDEKKNILQSAMRRYNAQPGYDLTFVWWKEIQELSEIIDQYSEYDFEEIITTWANTSEILNEISDSYFVFEMTKGLKDEMDVGSVLFVDTLNNLFEILFRGGNQIMFICNEDESKFTDPDLDIYHEDNYNKFLDFVHLHVNTDLKTVFFDNIAMDIEENSSLPSEYVWLEGTIGEFTLILDKHFATDEFYDTHLIPYLRMRLGFTATYISKEFILTNCYEYCDIQIIAQKQDGSFLDYSDNETISFDEFTYEDILYTDVYSIGESVEESEATAWINKMQEIRTGATFEVFPIYMYVAVAPLASEFDGMDELYTLGKGLYQFDEDLENLVYDFLKKDIDPDWHNWIGRAITTYKPIIGSGGWIEMPGSCRSLECWQTYMDEDLWYFYHEYDWEVYV